MLILVGYKIEIRSFRRKKRETFVPIYKDIGKGAPRQKPASKEIRRET